MDPTDWHSNQTLLENLLAVKHERPCPSAVLCIEPKLALLSLTLLQRNAPETSTDSKHLAFTKEMLLKNEKIMVGQADGDAGGAGDAASDMTSLFTWHTTSVP